MVAAGLEAHIRRGSPRPATGVRECGAFGMRPAVLGVPPLAHRLAVSDDHAPDHGIGFDTPPSPGAEPDGALEEAPVGGGKVGPGGGVRSLISRAEGRNEHRQRQ